MNANYYDTLRSYRRTELGVEMVCHVKRGGYTEIVATGPYPDWCSIFDHNAFSGATQNRMLRNALRRHARAVKRGASHE